MKREKYEMCQSLLREIDSFSSQNEIISETIEKVKAQNGTSRIYILGIGGETKIQLSTNDTVEILSGVAKNYCKAIKQRKDNLDQIMLGLINR